jgi:hypothetical protein
MLRQLGEYISACRRRAEECKEAAASETDDRIHGQLLDLEQQWQHLAQSYEFIETLGRFLLASHTLPPEDEKLLKDFPRNRKGPSSASGTLPSASHNDPKSGTELPTAPRAQY